MLLEAIHDRHWCGYVYVPVDKSQSGREEELWLTPVRDEQSGMSMYRFSRSPILANCPCNGGLSYYHKSISDRTKDSENLEHRYVCVGWDYDHIWDQDREYTLESTMRDAREVADYFADVLKLGAPHARG